MRAVIQARAVSWNVLIALAIVSAISYIPLYPLLFLYAWTDFRMYPTSYYVVFFVTYTLLFGNSCFNPIALYIVSRKFRGLTYISIAKERKTQLIIIPEYQEYQQTFL
jgi:hypothetical protein